VQHGARRGRRGELGGQRGPERGQRGGRAGRGRAGGWWGWRGCAFQGGEGGCHGGGERRCAVELVAAEDGFAGNGAGCEGAEQVVVELELQAYCFEGGALGEGVRCARFDVREVDLRWWRGIGGRGSAAAASLREEVFDG